MDEPTASRIGRWQAAGIIDAATATRIREWEAEHAPSQASRLGRIAFGFGGLLLAAGILLFVAANWALLSPWARFATVAATVALLHVAAGLVRARSESLATALHAAGTAALGGGVFLAGQTFHLAEQWPEGFLLWSVGAAFALWLLRDWPHVLWVAVLVPAWLVCEWLARGYGFFGGFASFGPPAVGLFVLGVAYLAATGGDRDATWRRALARLGAVTALLAGLALPFVGWRQGTESPLTVGLPAPPTAWLVTGWVVAIGLPLALAWRLRGREAWPMLLAAVFAVGVAALDTSSNSDRVLAHVLFLAVSVGLVWWGLRDARRLRVNLGVLGFALTVLSFYFSSVFVKLDRSLGLIGLGVLFIGGGWWLERARRRLLDRMQRGAT
jgi:uncharacterized membrane protein